MADGVFSFLHQDRELGWPPDWTGGGATLLWIYNLHYFEWIWALDWDLAKAAVDDWIVNYPPAKDRPGWEPYPLTLRLQNWSLFFFGRKRQALAEDPAFRQRLEQSILVQGSLLRRNTEYHLLGNHYFDNGASLAILGSIFNGPEPKRWHQAGVRILRKQIPEQILPDGTHFELSPMYQSRIAYLLLLLAEHGTGEARHLAESALPKLLAALALLTHPDGGIALLNDSAAGIYNPPRQIFKAAREADIDFSLPTTGSWSLPSAGYYGWRDESGNYLVFDAGNLGPDYIPGHAHGDIFSFELSLGGERFVVDSGLYQYLAGPMRSWCRSTAAHNTVEIEGIDQAEFWGAFRVARRGHPRDITYTGSPHGFKLEGWQDGYRRLPGRPTHWRRVSFRADPMVLKIRDRIRAQRPVTVVSRLHLHPEVSLNREKEFQYLVRRGRNACRIEFFGEGDLAATMTPYCPEFGIKLDAPCLSFSARSDFLTFGYSLRVLY